ncbi:MAG: LysM peptidoglycan-binding domain-containing protein [Alphaproteobacteria bacterium]|nr:LysM peptidoglycan-binding domain-containing protein [Alphaproteobacteria bacterium]MCB9791173.1 LysM peptidoglycan-binding domain-containing protein [Alphaproteobacteria bacterium]
MMWMLTVAGLSLSSPALAQEGTIISSGAPSSAPEQYVIQPGDTLWDISRAFLGDPYFWPQLWSINDYITNPHWIYPGNVILFQPGSLLEPPDMSIQGSGGGGYIAESLTFEAIAPECGPDVRFTQEVNTARYIAPGLIAEEDELEIWGELFASKSGMVALAEGDKVYLDLEDPELVQCGDVLSVFRKREAVRHPEARKVQYGDLYEVVAELVVVHHEDETVTAQVRTSYEEIRRGDLVGPNFPVHAELPVSAPRGDLDGTVIARLNADEAHLASVGETVFIDRGRADGLRVGNSFFVIQRRDPVLYGREDNERIPAQVVGRVVVVRVSENSSTAVVVDSSAAIDVGAKLAMQVE